MEVIGPIVAERDQLRALVESADVHRAHHQRTVERLREENHWLQEALNEQGPG